MYGRKIYVEDGPAVVFLSDLDRGPPLADRLVHGIDVKGDLERLFFFLIYIYCVHGGRRFEGLAEIDCFLTYYDYNNLCI